MREPPRAAGVGGRVEELGGDNDAGGYWGGWIVTGWEGGTCDLQQ